MPAISTIFCRPVAPCAMLIARLGRPRRCASRVMSASLAAPSTGGGVRRALSTPCSHAMALWLLRGMTRTVRRTGASPAGGKRLQQQRLDGDKEEESDQERHVEYAHRAHNAANGSYKGVG